MIGIELQEQMNVKAFEKAVEGEMHKQLKHFEHELLKIRTGRAHTSMIEDVKVSCYGTVMPLKEVAALTAPDVSMLMVQPWDMSIAVEIEKALGSSDLGVVPQNDGTVIRIQLPRMTTARRDELVKQLNKRLEEARVGLRTIRKDVHNYLRDGERAKKISEDLSRRLQDSLQKVTDKLIEAAEALSAKKEQELKTV
jgi:ribosome recycling factor